MHSISNVLSLAGTPMNSPVCLPVIVTCAEARSPLSTDGPTVALEVGERLRIVLTKKPTPSLPSG